MKALKNLLLSVTVLVLTNACILVEEPKLESFYMYLETVLLTTNQVKALNLSTVPAEFDPAELVWTSSNSEVAAVSDSGVVTALKPGVVQIVAQSKDGLMSDSCSVTVVKLVNYTAADGLLSNDASAIGMDSLGNMWFGTWLGVTKFDGRYFTPYSEADGFLKGFVRCIAFDAEGNGWFGTTAGLTKFDGTNWDGYTNYTQEPLYSTFYNISIDRHDRVWLATMTGAYALVDGRWVLSFENTNYWLDYIHDICFDKQDHFWLTPRSGLCKSDGKQVAYFSGASETLINGGEIFNLYIDKLENVWIAKSDVGILKLETGL